MLRVNQLRFEGQVTLAFEKQFISSFRQSGTTTQNEARGVCSQGSLPTCVPQSAGTKEHMRTSARLHPSHSASRLSRGLKGFTNLQP